MLKDRAHGRVVRVSSASDGTAVLYVVAEPDDAKALAAIRKAAAKSRDRIEIVGGASDHLLRALNVTAGAHRRI